MIDGITLAFCPTGEGGKVDNSCPPANKKTGYGPSVEAKLPRGWEEVHFTRVGINLTLQDLIGLAKTTENGYVRLLVVQDGTLFAWDAKLRTHDYMLSALHIDRRDNNAGRVINFLDPVSINEYKKWIKWTQESMAKSRENSQEVPDGIALAFCPTGEGGKVDNSCSPANKGAAERFDNQAGKPGDVKQAALIQHIEQLSARFPVFGKRVGEKLPLIVLRKGSETAPDVGGSISKDGGAIQLPIGGSEDQAAPKFGGYIVDRSLYGRVRHELGHAFQIRNGGTGAQEEQEWWSVAREVQKTVGWGKVSEYAATDRREAYAESFTAYTHAAYKQGQLPKPVEDYFDKYLKGSDMVEGIALAFCPTGKGGKVDNSCSPANKGDFKLSTDFEGTYLEYGEDNKVVTDYKEEGYIAINAYLRGETEGFEEDYGQSIEEVKETASKLLDVIARAEPLEEEVHVVRGRRSAKLFEAVSAGDIVQESAFVSTTTDEDTASSFGSHTMRIMVPKGTHAVWVGGDEKELLLNAGSKFEVLGKEQVGDKSTVVIMRLLSDG